MAEKKSNETFLFWGFLLPALLAYLVVVIIPFIMGIFFSFTDWSATGRPELNFRGLENYKIMFDNPQFLYSFLITFLFTFINMLLINITAFGLAILVTKELRLKNFYRSGFFIPNLIGGIVLGYIWQFIFAGILPSIGDTFNIPWLANFFVFTSPRSSLLALNVVSSWQYAGYIMMIYVAAIQNIPADLIGASKIDGANGRQRLRHITFPLVAQAFTICSFLTLVNSFKQFDVNIALTKGGPSTLFLDSTIQSTELLALNIYNTAFNFNKMAEAQAQAVVFFTILVIISLIQVSINKKREVEM